jgi:catechol 2,3-dioxygenase-like lactoylglutathione lyase family enzyme
MDARLNIVTLGVADLKRSRDFYEHGLGWKASSISSGEIAFFQLGGIVLALYPTDALAADALQEPKGTGFRGVTLAQNVAAKEEVAAVLRHAEQAGGRVVKPAQDVFWGGHSGYFADPDGHLWEVAWNPHFALDERGEVILPR